MGPTILSSRHVLLKILPISHRSTNSKLCANILQNVDSSRPTNFSRKLSNFQFKGLLCDKSSHNNRRDVRYDNWKSKSHATTKCMFSTNAADIQNGFLFRQLLDFKSYTFTYLLADIKSKEAILIDPVIETVERDIRLLNDHQLKLVCAANTHLHADHITGTGELKKRLNGCYSIISEASEAKADVKIKHGDLIKFGQFALEARSTPGHTNGCMTYVWHEHGMVFTGDTLLIRGCGRTDFQQGSAATLHDSVHEKIFSLPDHFKVFPAHDYTGQNMSTVGEEKMHNPRLLKSKSEFIKLMKNLKLPYPKQIDVALPANMVCGIFEDLKREN